MLFVAIARIRAGTMKERVERRARWNPESAGLKPIAEYWLATADPHVIQVFDTDNAATVFAGIADWDDVFDIEIHPAVTAEEGLKAMAGVAAAAAAPLAT